MRSALAIGAALLVAGCRTTDQTYAEGMEVLCGAATPTRARIADQAEREQVMSSWLEDHLHNDEVRAVYDAVMRRPPTDRPRVLRQAAALAEVTDCALADLFAMPPPPPPHDPVVPVEPVADVTVKRPPPVVVLDVSGPSSAPGTIEIADVVVSGEVSLTAAHVTARFKGSSLGDVASCYGAARASVPSLAGHVVIQLVVALDGRATEIHVNGLSPEFADCVAQRAGAWAFDPARAADGTATTASVTVQLDLSSPL